MQQCCKKNVKYATYISKYFLWYYSSFLSLFINSLIHF
jgi:hypothetical protein